MLCAFSNVRAQNTQQLAQIEDSLIVAADSMYNAFIPDERTAYCEKFVRQLVRALKTPNSYKYSFEKLGKKINIIAPDDNSFRIFNWLIVPEENRPRYYGAIQMNEEELRLYPLIDYSSELKTGGEDSVLNNGRWFGALYYRIVANKVNERKVYTLFGLNSANPVSNRKILDPLVFKEGGLEFGAPVFNVKSEHGGSRIKRYVMEYKKEVNASLNWDDEQKTIYFDKLVSQVNDPNRKYTYVPSGQYDGFKWQNGMWQYIQDLIPVQNVKDGDAPAPRPLSPK